MSTRLRSRLNQAIGGSGSQSISVTSKGRIEIALDAAIARAVELAIGHVQRQTTQGLDVDGRPFVPYSASYRRALLQGGESTHVDLLVTGGMMRGLREIRRRIVNGIVAEVVVGLGSTRSEQRRFADGKAKKTGKLSPPHSQLGAWINEGRGGQPKRRFLGLSAAARKRIAKEIERAGIFRQR